MDSRDPIKDFFTFLLGAVLLSMGAFLFFNQVMVSSQPIGLGRGLRFGQGIGRSWGGGYSSGFGGGGFGGGWGGGFGMHQGLGDSFGLLLIPLVIGVWLPGLIQSVSQALLPLLSASGEVDGIASTLCPTAPPPQPIST